MHQFEGWLNWVVCVAGVGLIAVGAGTLLRQRVALPRLRSRVAWRPHGWASVALGVFILVETLPRLAGASALVVLTCSVVALVPLAAALMLQSRARRLRVSGSG